MFMLTFAGGMALTSNPQNTCSQNAALSPAAEGHETSKPVLGVLTSWAFAVGLSASLCVCVCILCVVARSPSFGSSRACHVMSWSGLVTHDDTSQEFRPETQNANNAVPRTETRSMTEPASAGVAPIADAEVPRNVEVPLARAAKVSAAPPTTALSKSAPTEAHKQRYGGRTSVLRPPSTHRRHRLLDSPPQVGAEHSELREESVRDHDPGGGARHRFRERFEPRLLRRRMEVALHVF